MIIFIGFNRQRNNLLGYRKHPESPAHKFKTYNWLFRTAKLPAATYIFTMIDRLHVREKRLAGIIYRHINAAGEGFRALNDPAKAKNRFGLLRSLHDAGINNFDGYLASDSPKPEQFPVFVRNLSVSLPPLTDLIKNQTELESELARLQEWGEPLEDLVVIEYCAQPYKGDYFLKLSTYRIDDQFCLDLFIYNKGWYVKWAGPDIAPPNSSLAEWNMLQDNAFVADARRVFEIADIEYGRVDFSLVDGRPQFYEINFNPQFTIDEYETKDPQRLKNAIFAANRRIDAMKTLVHASDRPSINNIKDHEITAFRLRPWRNYAPQRY